MIAGLHRAVNPDTIELESDLALIAVVGRGIETDQRYGRQGSFPLWPTPMSM